MTDINVTTVNDYIQFKFKMNDLYTERLTFCSKKFMQCNDENNGEEMNFWLKEIDIVRTMLSHIAVYNDADRMLFDELLKQ